MSKNKPKMAYSRDLPKMILKNSSMFLVNCDLKCCQSSFPRTAPKSRGSQLIKTPPRG